MRILMVASIDAPCCAMQEYLEKPEFAQKCGSMAGRFVHDNFAVQSMVDNTINFYHKILSDKI